MRICFSIAMKQEILKTTVTFTVSENFTLLKAKYPFVSFVGMALKENTPQLLEGSSS